MNETFKKLETLSNLSSNQRKKRQCINDIVDTFEKTLDSDVNKEPDDKKIQQETRSYEGRTILYQSSKGISQL